MSPDDDDAVRAAVTRGCPGYGRTLEQNWNGNVRFGGTPAVPGSIEELQEIVKKAETGPIRVVGRGHSFSPVAECAGGTLVSLAKLNGIVDFVPPTPPAGDGSEEDGGAPAGKGTTIGSITVQGGTTYTEIAKFLGRRGALRNLPSCPQFTVAGAIATATHGSGAHIPNLAADVSMIEFVRADGSLVGYSRERHRDLLEGCRVHLGCLGVVSRLTLDVVPYFEVETYRYDDVPLENMIQALPDLWRRCDSLSVWTSGFGSGHGTGQCWMVFRHFLPHWDPDLAQPSHEIPPNLLGTSGTLCDRPINRYCTDLDNPVTFRPTGKLPWHDALTLTLQDGRETSMSVVDLQAEFFVPLENAQAAIRAVWDVARDWTFSSPWGYEGHVAEPEKGLVDAMEFRQVRGGDGAWLSPHPTDSLGIHVSFNGDPLVRPEVMERLLPELERALGTFRARPHWGKLAPLTFAPSRMEDLYGLENLGRFRDLCNVHDPNGKFRNSHIQGMLFAESGKDAAKN